MSGPYSREPIDLGLDDGDHAAEVLRLFDAAGSDPQSRARLVEIFRPLTESLARRYHGYGEALEDLVQVASIGLLNAIDRFDVGRGITFPAFATPTIVGELKRHFRDRGWSVRVPRRLQENTLKIRQTMPDLAQSLGRSPTVAELADASGMTEDDVLEASEALLAYSATSLDTPLGDEVTLGETLADAGGDIEIAEEWADLAPHIARLPDRERTILALRFFRGLTQTEIAEEVGLSQMHVSRLLGRALGTLRVALAPPDG
ncbi:MAG: SigB/SigF/SigG family RNA polymerase sigma factor [Actinomycetota bacterium]